MSTSKSLATLEYDKIIQRLAALTETAAGRELALALTPSPVYTEVVRRQRLTAEAGQLREMKPGLSLAAARDVRELARQAALGHVLSPGELLDVAATLSLARTVRDTLGRLRAYLPLLAEIADAIPDLAEVTAEINRCVDQRAEVTDAASPVLAQLRRETRQAHDRLYERLHRLINSAAGRQALQEPIVTLRDGRYVIPVKAEMRGLIPGIVHDVSSSGATVFLEPLELVELGNTWRELQLEEEREVQRVLRHLSARVGEAAAGVVAAVEALAQVDLALAKARLGETLACHDLPCAGQDQSWLAPSPGLLRLVNARHPLLKGHVVPISLWAGHEDGEAGSGDGFSVLLITGPNTGGKTVALKTVGLLALMAQAGLPVPAEKGSRFPAFDGVYADIGDEQSIEQSLSTFSSHMGNIIGILREAGPHSLVLLDEMAAGTDPTEGSALAQAVVRHLLELGCLTLATTHHGTLKAFAQQTAGVMNASVEFDPQTLAPTYHIRMGLPGQSNALAIAQRLGLPEPILDEARRFLPGGHLEVESLIADLQRERDAAAAAGQAVEAALRQAEALHRRREERLAALEARRQRLLEETRLQMEAELAEARAQLREAVELAQRAERQAPSTGSGQAPSTSSGEALEEARQKVEAVEQRAARLRRRRRRRPLPAIAAGDLVWLRDLSQPGEALSAPGEGEVEVRLGALRAKVKLADIERVEKREAPPPTWGVTVAPAPGRVPGEVEVRGRTVDEALYEIDRWLDEAFRAGLGRVRIIHGKGTGTLRRVVQEALAKHPLVKSFSLAPPKEGGEGVTVVELAS